MPVKFAFNAKAIFPMIIMFPVTTIETIGDVSGITQGGLDREATDKELSDGVICVGVESSFATFFGVLLPNTSFSQNVGLVGMTHIVNRSVIAISGLALVVCGLFPKLAAVISIMPYSVLGGAAVLIFASITVSGIELLTKEKLTNRNITILSLGFGYSLESSSATVASLPSALQLIFSDGGIVPATIFAIFLNIILQKEAEKKY